MRFIRFVRLFENDGEVPLSGTGTSRPVVVVPSGEPEPITRGVTCEFCECRLDTRGAVLIRGDEAKRFQNLEVVNDKLSRDLEAARARIAELTAQLPPAADKKPFFSW